MYIGHGNPRDARIYSCIYLFLLSIIFSLTSHVCFSHFLFACSIVSLYQQFHTANEQLIIIFQRVGSQIRRFIHVSTDEVYGENLAGVDDN